MKKILLLLMPLLCIPILASCTSSYPESLRTPNATPVATPTSYKVGDEINADGLVLKVYGTEKYTEKNPYMKPKEGAEYMAVDIEVKNNSSETESYNTLEFKLEDDRGYQYDPASTMKERNFGSGDLQPTLKNRGYIVFEVPTGWKSLKLIYDPISFSSKSKQVIINL